jgi:SAM-dependent methyltransferase
MSSNTKFKLPFVYQLQNTPSNPGNIPNSLEFEIENDENLGLIKQKYSKITDEYLNKAYKLGSVIGGNTLEDEIGDNYTNGVLEYMESILKINEYSGKKVLEIGSGIGYLLSKIKERKGTVLGVEPGEQGQLGAEKFNIPVIQGFYPEVNIDEKFDIIVSYCVLEHVTDPLLFLTKLEPLLKKEGKVFIIVPNESPYIISGDMSTFFHEHWSYFTEKSLKNCLTRVNAVDINIECSKFGGLLFSSFSFNDIETINSRASISKAQEDNSEYSNFLETIEENAKKINSYLKDIENVGVYVPLRIVNYLINYGIDVGKVRFFDDDQYSYDKFFPGIDVKIENFDDFIKNPPSQVLIMSYFFEDIIISKINKANVKDVKIISWSQIFSKL